MKAVVTGGAGFIGSHMVDRLLADGIDVTVIDNYSTGRPQNLAHVAGRADITVHEADLAETDRLEEMVNGADWVFHFAGLADIVPSIERPRDYYRANVEGTFRLLEASRKTCVRRFLYAASSTCYGIPDVYPTPETAPIRPQYPYAMTKRIGEELTLHWAQIYGLPALSLRMFNVYGPRSRTSGTYGAVFGVFLAQKLADRPYTVVGDGKQTRDFTFVSDVVEAFVAAARSDAVGEAINIGSGYTYSVNRLVELLGGDKVHIPKRPGEPDCTFADIGKIGRVLGWKPHIGLEEGVAKMLENIDYWREAPVWTPDRIAVATADWFKYLGQESKP